MKFLSRAVLLGLFCFGVAACASHAAQPEYKVGTPPKPRYDAKTELEQGQYMKKK